MKKVYKIYQDEDGWWADTEEHGDFPIEDSLAEYIQDIEKQVEELKEGYECALSHIKTLNDGVLMSQNIWDKVIAQADDLLNVDY